MPVMLYNNLADEAKVFEIFLLRNNFANSGSVLDISDDFVSFHIIITWLDFISEISFHF